MSTQSMTHATYTDIHIGPSCYCLLRAWNFRRCWGNIKHLSFIGAVDGSCPRHQPLTRHVVVYIGCCLFGLVSAGAHAQCALEHSYTYTIHTVDHGNANTCAPLTYTTLADVALAILPDVIHKRHASCLSSILNKKDNWKERKKKRAEPSDSWKSDKIGDNHWIFCKCVAATFVACSYFCFYPKPSD